MAVPPTRLPELLVSDDGSKTAFNFRGVVLGCKDLVLRIAGNADIEFPVSGLLINTSDSRLSDDRTADSIRTATVKAIAIAVDPTTNQVLGYNGTAWAPMTVVLTNDSRLTDDRTADSIRTATVKAIGGSDPATNQVLGYNGTQWQPMTVVLTSDSRLTDDRVADGIRTATVKNISTAADPTTNQGMVFDGTLWKPVSIVLDSDSRLTDDRVADAIRTNAVHGIDTGAPAAGHVLAWMAANSKWASKLPAEYHSNTVSPVGTSSGSVVMMGVAGSITPTHKTRMLLTGSGSLKYTGTDSRGGAVGISYGTGAAPANGDAQTGTQASVGYNDRLTANANQVVPFGLCAIVTGLTIGTTYWLDFSLQSLSTGGTASITQCKLSAIEV